MLLPVVALRRRVHKLNVSHVFVESVLSGRGGGGEKGCGWRGDLGEGGRSCEKTWIGRGCEARKHESTKKQESAKKEKKLESKRTERHPQWRSRRATAPSAPAATVPGVDGLTGKSKARVAERASY